MLRLFTVTDSGSGAVSADAEWAKRNAVSFRRSHSGTGQLCNKSRLVIKQSSHRGSRQV